MQLSFTSDELAFQAEAEALVREYREPGDPTPPDPELVEAWTRALIERGWQAYKWPLEAGGPGWSATQRYIWERTCGAAALPPSLRGMGFSMIGPILFAFGTDAQKEEHLPRILADEVHWCQGYSEPGSGSDLASLRTAAERDGQEYRVTGTKIWTSGAHKADWMFALTRTRTMERRQQGITFLLIDMRSPGVDVRPIISIDQGHTLNEVVLDGVRVPIANRVGEEDDGWTVAKGLLTHERTGLAFVSESRRKLAVLRGALADWNGLDSGSRRDLRAKVDAVEVELDALQFTELRTLAESSNGAAPGAQSSILKLKGTLIIQRMTELLIECSALSGLPYPVVDHEPQSGSLYPHWCQAEMQQYLIARSASIAGGSDEVQRNIIAKQVLGL